jgi:hypothetical protein
MGGGPLWPGRILGFLKWPKGLLVAKTCSQINILIFSFPKTPKTATFIIYFCRYRLPNDEGQNWKFSSQKKSKLKILSYRREIYIKIKLRTSTIQFQPKKERIFAKKIFLKIFLIFATCSRTPWNFRCSIFQKFPKKNPKMALLGSIKHWKEQSHEFWWT